MKNKIVCALAATMLTSMALRAEIENNTIIIKLKKNTECLNNWARNNKSGEISELNSVVGEHKTKSFISDKFFPKFSKVEELLVSASKMEGLSRIVIVEYKSDINPNVLVQKLSNLDYIEYAEPMPIHKISSVPNDYYFENQYYLGIVNSLQACDAINSKDTVIVGVVDTGVDYLHEDLAANIFQNPGESGLDAEGDDKSNNGIDDDGNGFIDDIHGWDFVGVGNPDTDDNDPMPGNTHGTHVAGTIGAVTNNSIGIAGVAKNVKIIPIKIGADSPGSRTTSRGYEGILYAAKMGAKIINCSWGSSTSSNAEQEVISLANSIGALVIGAAGNDASPKPNYPASYIGAVSVAAIDRDSSAAYFSNYGETVDIAAPGVNIIATLPSNTYGNMSGTSMASPVAAGVAALVSLAHPTLNPRQLKEFLKATANPVLYTVNPTLIGQFGTGIVDAYKAVTAQNLYAFEISNYSFIKNNDPNNAVIDDEMTCDINVNNLLDPISNINALVVPSDETTKSYVAMLDDKFSVGDLKYEESKLIESAIKFKIIKSIPEDTKLKFKITFTNASDTLKVAFINVLVNKSFLDLSNNDLLLTFNGRGNMAFNDFPDNKQGNGFRYKNSVSMLFEGGLMLAVKSDSSTLFDGVRAVNSTPNKDFISLERITENQETQYLKVVHSKYKTSETLDSINKFNIEQYSYASSLSDVKNYIINEYKLTNKSDNDMDSVYLGIYFDWDIGTSGQNCIAFYDYEKNFAYTYNTTISGLPWIGIKSLSSYPINYYGIDNNSELGDEIGVYNGFTKSEKFKSMTSGIARDTTSITDISQVISAGPFSLKVGETKTIPFSIFAGYNFDEIAQAANNSKNYLSVLSVLEHQHKELGKISVYPNPSKLDICSIALSIEIDANYTLEIFNLTGDKIGTIFNNLEYSKGEYIIDYNISELSVGTYYFVLSDKNKKSIVKKYVVTN